MPFVPVTPIILQGFKRKSASVCVNIFSFASALSLFFTITPGDCKIMSYSELL